MQLLSFLLVIWLGTLGTAATQTAQAQTVIIEKEVPDSNQVPDLFGANRVHFVYPFGTFGVMLGPTHGNGLPIRYGRSTYYRLGAAYKLKFTPMLSSVLELAYHRNRYLLQQDSSKRFPTAEIHDQSRFVLQNLSPALLVRLNFDPRRGNVFGTFVEAGASLEWVVSNHYRTEDDANGAAQRIQSRQFGLDYIAPFHWNALLRVGWSRVMATLAYRPGWILEQNERVGGRPVAVDFPRWQLGVRVNLY
jgi:hypothetical protein